MPPEHQVSRGLLSCLSTARPGSGVDQLLASGVSLARHLACTHLMKCLHPPPGLQVIDVPFGTIDDDAVFGGGSDEVGDLRIRAAVGLPSVQDALDDEGIVEVFQVAGVCLVLVGTARAGVVDAADGLAEVAVRLRSSHRSLLPGWCDRHWSQMDRYNFR